jgi:hypothetical protein
MESGNRQSQFRILNFELWNPDLHRETRLTWACLP